MIAIAVIKGKDLERPICVEGLSATESQMVADTLSLNDPITAPRVDENLDDAYFKHALWIHASAHPIRKNCVIGLVKNLLITNFAPVEISRVGREFSFIVHQGSVSFKIATDSYHSIIDSPAIDYRPHTIDFVVSAQTSVLANSPELAFSILNHKLFIGYQDHLGTNIPATVTSIFPK